MSLLSADFVLYHYSRTDYPVAGCDKAVDVQDSSVIAGVLASPAYRERCDLVYELFQHTRQAETNPFAITEMQKALGTLILEFQTKKSEFKREKQPLGVAVTRQLILLLNQIADSMAWRALNYDRVLVQLLSEHQKTGHIDDTIHDDLRQAEKLVNDYGVIVLVNDLTTVLRHGDLTIITGSGFAIQETKHGKASAGNARAIRQKRTLDALRSFLTTGTRSVAGRRDYIFQANVPVQSYHEQVSQIINEAQRKGYYGKQLSNCVGVEALWMDDMQAQFPQIRPFAARSHAVTLHNLQVFDQPKTRCAPFGIFPFDDQTCFALMRGSLLLCVSLNFEALRGVYQRYGLDLVLPQPSDQEIIEYTTSPIEKRKKLMDRGRFTIRDGKRSFSITPDCYGRIWTDLINEETLVQADRQLANMVSELQIPNDKTTRFYVGYANERDLWR